MGPCCGRKKTETAGRLPKAAAPWIIGSTQTPRGEVPRVSTTLRTADRLGAWKVRWGIGRMGYAVEPGLYAVGNPAADSPVLVSVKYALLIAVCFVFLAGLGPGGYAWDRVLGAGLLAAALFLGTWAGSTVLTPVLLPWLPGRALSAKGGWLGLAFLLGLVAYVRFQPAVFESWLSPLAWCLMIPTLASFMAMNFTGSTTYTSLSGVRREMRVAVPLQVAGAAAGVTFWLIGRFV